MDLIDPEHELVRLVELIDWSVFECEFGGQFVSTTGRPALLSLLVAEVPYLKHTFALSDKDVVER